MILIFRKSGLINEFDHDFITNIYLPQNQKALVNISKKMEKEEINSLFRNTLGTLMKGGYALLWEVKYIKYG